MDIWDLIPWAVDQFGSRIAIVDPDVPYNGIGAPPTTETQQLLTYTQLGDRCCCLAAMMKATTGDGRCTGAGGTGWGWSVSRGGRVGVMLRNSAAAIEAHFACAAIHAVVVNVNVSLAPAELAHVLRDSGCEALIVSYEFHSVVSAAIQILTQGDITPGASSTGYLRIVAWVGTNAGIATTEVLGVQWALTEVKFEGESSPCLPPQR